MRAKNSRLDSKNCRIGEYYPDNLGDDERTAIRRELARQWACIAGGGEWDPGRPAEPILALLNGHLAWCRIPGAEAGKDGCVVIPTSSPFAINGEASWIAAWDRPDGVYVTLSSTGAEQLGVEPVGLTRRRRRLAAGTGVIEVDPGRFVLNGMTDAVGDSLTGDTALMRGGEWLHVVYTTGNKQRPDGPTLPLYRWAPQEGRYRWWRAHQPFDSLDAIGVEGIADECCEAERAKVFTRMTAEDEAQEAMEEAIDRAMTARVE